MTADPLRRRAGSRFPGGALALAVALGSSIGLAACGGGGGGGDGGGAGVQIRGTVPDNRPLASDQLEIRAASGERSRAAIGADGRFSAGSLQGSGPYLLRASFSDGDAWYALTELAAEGVTTMNVHAYTDLALKSAVASSGASLDDVFDADGAIPAGMLPDAGRLRAVDDAIDTILAPSLEANGLAGTDLSRVSFAAGDERVDKFLSENPAVVEDGAFTILATDPVTDTRTTVAEQVPLSRDLTAADTVSPEPPARLRSLPAASNEIVLVWEAAKDDVAVTRYEVSRDGQPIATTPFPVHADLPLEGGTDYRYTIVAIDAAGNRSDATPDSVASPLADPDTTPPPAPRDVQVSVANASARVAWTQDGVADVAAFRVLRSVGSGMLDVVSRSTSTGLTDLDLSAATEYCYQVIAIDASENASDPSAISCATTTGTGRLTRPLAPVTPPPVDRPPTPTSGGAAAALLALDVSGLACELEVEESTVAAAVTLDAPCYRAPAGLRIRENGRLTIAPGTVLKFGSGRGIRVDRGGSLTARGTAAEPIVLSGVEQTAGYWSGVELVFSNSVNNVLENVLIEYGGSASAAALTSTAASSSPVRLAVSTVALRQSAGAGFDLDRGTILDAFTDVVATANARPGTVHAEVAGTLVPPLALTGNAVDALDIGGGSNNSVDTTTAWPAIDVPYDVGGLTLDAPLSLPPGAVLRFSSGSSVRINDGGSLRAIGSADAPILLTGRESTPGFWDGVNLVFSNSVDNVFRHVTIEYAGDGSSSGAALASISGSSSPVRLALEDVTLRNGLGPGFRFGPNTRVTAFDRVTSTGNARSGVIYPGWIPETVTAPALTGNTDDTVRLVGDTIATAVRWPALDVPYRIDNITVNAALTIDAGTRVVANGGAEIRVNREGSLNAVGTAGRPIVFVGDSPLPGFWDGFYFVFSNSPLNRFENVEVRHGGQGDAATRGNVTLLCGSTSPSRLAVVGSTLADSAGWGIYRSASGCTVDVDETTSLAGNASGPINAIEP